MVAITASIVAFGIAGPVWASGGDTATGSTANTILIKQEGKTLKFVAPKTIVAGEDLTITNTTNAKKVGPHTVSLVTESEVPQTKKERKACFTPKHICKAIAGWHGVKGNGPPTKNPAEAGKDGWDTDRQSDQEG